MKLSIEIPDRERLRLEELIKAASRKRPDIFLCHSRVDQDFVRKLAQDLIRLSVAPWFDEWELAPGHSLHQQIGTAIESSKHLGFVLSPASVASSWCMGELNDALSLEKSTGREFVIPLRYQDAEVPAFLRDKKHIDFGADYLAAIAKLASHIRGVEQRLVDQAVVTKSLELLEDVARFLNANDKKVLNIGSSDWAKIVEILRKHDVEPGDTISFFDHRRGGPFIAS